MAVVVESSTSNGVSAYQTDLTVTKPTGVATGDLIVVLALGMNFAGTAITMSLSGFTSRGTSNNTYLVAQVFERTADGSEGSTFTLTATNDDYLVAFAYRLSGAQFDVLASADSAGGFDSAHNLPSVTTTANDTILLAAYRGWTDLLTAGPSGWTQDYGPVDTGYAYQQSQTSAGASGADTMTPLDSDRWVSIVAAYKPTVTPSDPFPPLWSYRSPILRR